MGDSLKEVNGEEAAYLIPLGLTASFNKETGTIQVNMAGGKKLIIKPDMTVSDRGMLPKLQFFSFTP